MALIAGKRLAPVAEQITIKIRVIKIDVAADEEVFRIRSIKMRPIRACNGSDPSSLMSSAV